jgi:hypothetical protein
MQPTPKPDPLQRYGADLSDWAYSQATVRRMLDEAHAHYEAQVRPLAGLAKPDAGSQALGDARIDAMASAGKVALLTAKVADLSALLAKESTRNDTLVGAMKDAARTLEGAPYFAYTVANGLRRAAE